MNKICPNFRKGFTLIEIIISIAILSIIAISIITVLTGSFSNIVKVGNLTRSMYDDKGKIEQIIAKRENLEVDGTSLFYEDAVVPIKFINKSGNPVLIEGGKIIIDDIVTFVTEVPTIKITPNRFYEGYLGTNEGNMVTDIIIVAKRFTIDNNTKVKVNGNNFSNFTINGNIIKLSGNPNVWKNEFQPHEIEVMAGTKNAKGKVRISQPRVMVVGMKNIKITSDLENFSYWKDRNAINNSNLDLNKVIYMDNELARGYITIGNQGTIHALYENNGWTSIDNNVSDEDLMDIAYSDEEIIFVGKNGTILSLCNKNNLKEISITDFTEDLRGVSFGRFEDEEIFITVGNNFSWLERNKENEWKQIDISSGDSHEEVDLYDIETIYYKDSSGKLQTMFISVGSKGTIITKKNSEVPGNLISVGDKDLKAIAFNGDHSDPIVVTVGDNGTVLYSDNSNNELSSKWSKIDIGNGSSELSFSDISFIDNKFLAVGNKNNAGFIAISLDGKSWETKDNALGNKNIKGISGY